MLRPETDGAEELLLVKDGFGDNKVAVVSCEFRLRGRQGLELRAIDVIAVVAGE